MSVCWALTLGDCSQKISREHLVSRALFQGDEITVQGFAWCKGESKQIGLANLTSKILCRKHNSDLSEVDDAGAKAFASMREMMGLSNVRSAMKPRIWNIERRYVDGHLLERWFLKTLINLAFDGEHRIGADSTEMGKPSQRLVEICFGSAKFQGRAGLYSAVHAGQNIESTDRFSFAPLIFEGTHVAGGLFSFRGFRYVLFLKEEGISRLPRGIGMPGEDWSVSQLNFHNKEIREVTGKHLSQVLHTRW